MSAPIIIHHGALSAGYGYRDGTLVRLCVCRHDVHTNGPCMVGVATGREATEAPCGCPATCWRCLNMRFVTVHAGSEREDQIDCPVCVA